ncbi:MAG: DUF3570 domain-containing protein [Saprospiraceae bacterium]|nr:DUF3570 domain-containing protein [Saprospiraceae bacterium]
MVRIKKRFALGCFVLSNCFAQAQTPPDSIPPPPSKTEIELVYSHYIQEGNHSAVTGGEGTEKLMVYGPSFNLKNTRKKRTLTLNLGSDLITSASTDRIDFVMSSASKHDARNYVNAAYTLKSEKRGLSFTGGAGISMESDYLSLSQTLGIVKTDKHELRTLSASLQAFNDDLRWGRLNPDYYRPVKLVYPIELRKTEWFDEYRRQSYTLKMGWTQVVNKRNVVGIFPEFGLQKGLLSTPFHRIFFQDGEKAVEKLPDKRLKGLAAFKWNRFVGGRTIIKSTLSAYTDDWGIVSVSVENETAVKFSGLFTLVPHLRFYAQKASPYFAKKGLHTSDEPYFTSDFDLSKFHSYKAGMRLKYYPRNLHPRRWLVNGWNLDYALYFRSDGLSAHIFTLSFDLSFTKT